MSDGMKNQSLIILGIVTSVLTIGGTMLTVGSLKGELITKVNEHARVLEHHDAKLDRLNTDVTDLKARVHGVASQVGRLPGQVAAKQQAVEVDE
jgi:outer membrane murein-binding lipoprotein Lpp